MIGEPQLADPIGHLVGQLRQTDLRPSPKVDALFSRLVELAGHLPTDHPYIRDPLLLAEIRRMCAEGETHLERLWARRVCAEPARLTAFPYLDNYRDLAHAEHQALVSTSLRPLRHVVFAGCGPLPLTAVMLSNIAPDLQITCLDVDIGSVRLARRVLRALVCPRNQVAVIHADAAHFDYSAADAVLVAALVGTSPHEKLLLIEKIAATVEDDVTLAARSVPDDGRQLLYPRLDPAGPSERIAVLGEWQPPPGVINSLLLMRPARRGPRDGESWPAPSGR